MIADLSQITSLFVKEQRADGSLIPVNNKYILNNYNNNTYITKGIIRCALVAGKPVFGRNTPLYSNFNTLSFVKSNNNLLSYQVRSIHINSKDKDLSLNPYFVTGLIDAEGCFMLPLRASEKYKQKYQANLLFSMSMDAKDKDLLIKLKNYFGVGSIVSHGSTTIRYKISSLKDMSILISHCDKYPLRSQKRVDYELFKQAYELMKAKSHLSESGLKEIVSVRASMNQGLTEELTADFPDIVPKSKPIFKDLTVQDPNWISGFTSGDGCFHVSLYKSSFTKSGYGIVLRLQLAQHNRDFLLLKSLISYLGCGRVEENLKHSASYYVVSKFDDIIEKVIPFFDKYQIEGVKSLDYQCFKEIALLMQEKQHLTHEGLEKIKSLKSGMNKSRLTR